MARSVVLIAAIAAFILAPAAATQAAAPGDPTDLTVAVTDGPDPSGPGGAITYTITVRDAGAEPAATVALAVDTPANTVFGALGAPRDWKITTPPVGAAGTVTASTATLAPGGTGAVFKLTVLVTGGEQVDLTATVSSGTPDPDPGNNTATTSTVVQNAANLAVKVADNPGPVAAGAPLSYSITLTDAGPAAAANPEISVATPDNTVFTSFTAPSGWTVKAPPAGGTGTVTATATSVPPGGSGATFTLVLTVIPGTAHGTQLNLSPAVKSGTPDPDEANNTVKAATAVANAGDLAVTVTSTPDPAAAGGTVTYALTLTNNGPVAAVNAALTADIPTGTTFASFTAPTGWTTSTPAAGATGAVSATVPTLASGGSATFVLVVTTASTGQVTLTANASSTTNDPSGANNTDTVTTAVAAAASADPGAGGPRRGGLPLTGSSMVRVAGITVVLLGLGILSVALGRSRRLRRRYGR